jgi:tetratricopeptide (TPR) repeat protein
MRPFASAIGLALLISTPLFAQIAIVGVPAPGGFVVPARPIGPHWHYHGGHYSHSVTIVVIPAPLFASDGVPLDVQRFVERLPQFPPASEREILARIIPPLPPPQPAPAPKPDFAAKPPMLAPPPAADKDEESERQIRLGRESFASGQIGRAAEQFQRAIDASPKRALPYFLLGQARFALGRYREAVVSILAGLKLEPNWPNTVFNPRDLYEGNAADAALDLDQLHQAAERNPDEPALSFLYGYQLWLNGRRAEARKYFDRALASTADPTPIRLFLNAPPPLSR